MNHSLWEITLYTRHRHAELVAARRTCGPRALVPQQLALATLRRTLGLRLIAAGRVIAGVDALRDAAAPLPAPGH